MINKKGLPPYKVVYEILRKRITDGIYQKGDILPSENELCTTHEVTRPTIRKALDRLVHEGYIRKKQGKGSIVQGQPHGVGILSLSGTTSAIGKENLQTKIIIKPHLEKFEDKAFGFPLQTIEKEVGCYRLERLRIVNNNPVFYDITLIPNINIPRFANRNFENRSLFGIMRKAYQIEVTGGEQKLLAISADEKLQEYFRLKSEQPILRLDRKMETNKEGFFFYSQVYCNTADYGLYGTF
ncbi:GntR family transcriptional regulator [Saccharicrinis fermentans]|uniref:HTH-type transcriptional regulator FrlR n=1 Tax=Saccharicrinis fermentans DSM 9555 = JCM 21142 TaxID=869213 RepID=W7XV58_9BACT|nr:GntR family transcriptional regulator [Saccharicrinis fermentans]GAF01960.1 HTH-type transcriptional regulator FrlR [Saccharicrinis fermentans DSM 9555 = JCM 21142]